MGGIYGLVDALLRAARLTPAPWVGPAVVLALAALTSPWWWSNQRVARGRTLIGRSLPAGRAERQRLDAEVERIAGEHPGRLGALAEHAFEHGRADLGRQLLDRLEAGRRRPELARRLRRRLAPPPPASALAAALQVERMRADGLSDEAEAVLMRALVLWPEDAELRRLRAPPTQEPAAGAGVRDGPSPPPRPVVGPRGRHRRRYPGARTARRRR